MSAKIVKELLTRWSYKVDTKQLVQASRMIKILKKDQDGIRKSSAAFASGEVANVKKMTRAWRGLNKQVKSYGGKGGQGGKKGAGGGRGFGGLGAGGSGSLPFLIGRLAGSNALTSALFAGPAAVGFLGGLKALQAAGDKEQSKAAFTGLLGGKGQEGVAGGLLEDLNVFGAKTPFNIKQLRGLSENLLASGFAAKELIPTLRTLGNVTGANQERLQRVLFNFTEIKRIGNATRVDLKQFARAGIPIFAVLEKQLGITGQELAKMTRAGKVSFKIINDAFKKMTTGSGQFAGRLDAMNKALAGRMGELGDELQRIAEDFGEAFLPVAKAVLNVVISMLKAFRTGPLNAFVRVFNGLVFIMSEFAKNEVVAATFRAIGDGIIFIGKTIAGVLLLMNPWLIALGLLLLFLEDFAVWLRGGDSVIGRLLDFDWGQVFDGMWIAFKEQMQKIVDTIAESTVLSWLFSAAASAATGTSAIKGSGSIDPAGGGGINSDVTFNQSNSIEGGGGKSQTTSEMISEFGNDALKIVNDVLVPTFAM